MILDTLAEFCDATALDTSGTGLAFIGSAYDAGIARDLGNGQALYLVINVTTAVDSAGDGASVEFQLVSDDSATPAADGSETLHLKTDAIAEATLVAGFQLCLPIPLGVGIEYERYLGIQQNVSGEAVTAGAIDAFLTYDPHGWKSYPDATN